MMIVLPTPTLSSACAIEVSVQVKMKKVRSWCRSMESFLGLNVVTNGTTAANNSAKVRAAMRLENAPGLVDDTWRRTNRLPAQAASGDRLRLYYVSNDYLPIICTRAIPQRRLRSA